MVVKIAPYAEIEASRKEWNSLVSAMHLPSVFLTWDWITTWIEHFGHHYNLLILFVHDEDKLTAIFPLAERTMRLEDGVIPTRTITMCGALELYPDHLDLICSNREKAHKSLKAIFDFLSRAYRKWDTISLPYLSSTGHLASYLSSMKCRDMTTRFEGKTWAPYITLDGGVNAFLAQNFNNKRRHELRRQSRVLYEDRKATFRSITDSKQIDEAIGHLVRLHLARKDDIDVTSTFATSALVEFHREVASRFYRNGWLRFYFVEDQSGEPISAAYGFLYEGRFSYYQSGMAPGWNKYSPGKVTVFSMLKDLYVEGAEELDFLGGDQEYKSFWTKTRREMVWYKVFNGTLGARIESFGSQLTRRAKMMLRKGEFPEGGRHVVKE